MVNANSDGRQPEPHRRDAAGRAVGAAIRHQAIGGISQVPKVIETRLLHVIEKLIVVGKEVRRGGYICRRSAFQGRSCDRGNLIIIGLIIFKVEQVAKTGGIQQAWSLQSKWAKAVGGPVNAVTCEIGFRIWIPVQNDATISSSSNQSGRAL